MLAASICALTASAAFSEDFPLAHPFKVEGQPGYKPLMVSLRGLVAHTSRQNHLCVIGDRFEDGSSSAWVYWREGRAIILLETTKGAARDLKLSQRYLRFGKDIVPEGTPGLESSTYLTTIDWANGLIQQCASQGTSFVLDSTR